jgi:hypothetical protein
LQQLLLLQWLQEKTHTESTYFAQDACIAHMCDRVCEYA